MSESSDMQILVEIRQLQAALPGLKAAAKVAAKAYKDACAPLRPARDTLKATKAAAKAAQTRLAELCGPEGGT